MTAAWIIISIGVAVAWLWWIGFDRFKKEQVYFDGFWKVRRGGQYIAGALKYAINVSQFSPNEAKLIQKHCKWIEKQTSTFEGYDELIGQ